MTEKQQSTIIGPFSINLRQDGSVEFRTLNQVDSNTLSASQTMELLDFLESYRGKLSHFASQTGEQALGELPDD
jgi:hypothetical protein